MGHARRAARAAWLRRVLIANAAQGMSRSQEEYDAPPRPIGGTQCRGVFEAVTWSRGHDKPQGFLTRLLESFPCMPLAGS